MARADSPIGHDRSRLTLSAPPDAPIPGDDLIRDANLVFDQVFDLDREPELVWPWLVQLGKRRAGWYLPAAMERWLPSTRRGLWRLEPRFQAIAVGDRIPDYGGPDEWLEVARLDPPHALVYTTERHGRPFSWALVLTPVGPRHTRLRLRFRGEIRSRGLVRRMVMTGGGFFDAQTGRLMVAGLAERLAAGSSVPTGLATP